MNALLLEGLSNKAIAQDLDDQCADRRIPHQPLLWHENRMPQPTWNW